MRISHGAERTRRALWVIYIRLTSTRLHKFYTLTLLLTLLPLIILHLVALLNTNTGLNKLSLLLATTNSTNANSLVPTVTDQNGQGILRLCNVGQVDCQTVTSVAPTATAAVTSTSTPTPQQVASPVNTAPVNAGVAPTSSASPVPTVAIQPGGARPASPASPISSQSGSSPSAPFPSSSALPANSDGGVLIAAPPAQTQTQATSSSSSTSAGVFIADAPSTTSSTSTSTASTSQKSGGGNDKNSGNGQGQGNGKGKSNGQDTSTETSKTKTELTLPSTSSEIPSATGISTSTATGESSSSSTTSAEKETKTGADSSVASSTTKSSTSESSPPTSTSSVVTEPPSSTPTSPRSEETNSRSKETETTTPPVGKDVSVKDVTLSSTGTDTATRVLPSLVRPEFESSTVLSSSVQIVQPTIPSSTSSTVSSTSSTTSPASPSSPTSSSSSVDEATDGTKETQKEVGVTGIDKQESASTSRTSESSTPTPTTSGSSTSTSSKSKSESTSTASAESAEVPAPSTSNTRTLALRDLSSQALPLRARAFSATPITNSTTGSLDGIDVTDVGDTGGTEVTRLGVVCAIAMALPRDQLRQEWMENLTMAAFYLGMLGVGIAAILNESVAHLITISLSILLSLLWTGTQLVRTHYVHDQFDAFITRGACSGIDVLPSYWAQRTRLELPILIINALALLFLGVLGVQLLKRYHREGGGRGGGLERYVYKVVVVLRCAVLLGGFLLAASMVIWVHLLFTNAGVVGASGVDLLKALGIVSLLFVAPWGVLGWLALNAATPSTSGAYNGGDGKWGRWWGKRTMMGLFCGLNVLFLGGWVATFASDIYRAVFLAWTFFAVLSIAGFFVLMGSLGAGVVCWMRFARDLEDFDSEKPPSDIMSRPFSIASIDPFGVRPSVHSHSHSGQSHSHVHGGLGVGLGVSGGPESLRWDYSNTAEKAWEPFDTTSIRQSQFTASEGRQSTVFSYGLRSPAPPMPTRPEYGSSNNSNVTLGLAM